MSMLSVSKPPRSVVDRTPQEPRNTGWDVVADEIDRGDLIKELHRAADSCCPEWALHQQWYAHDAGRTDAYMSRLLRLAARELS